MSDPRLHGPAYLDEPVAFELLKLLVQVAWADHELHRDEIESLLQVADALLPSDERLEAVEAWIEGREPLPPPDLKQLRGHRSAVLLEVKRVLQADGRVTLDEESMYAHVKRLLDEERAEI